MTTKHAAPEGAEREAFEDKYQTSADDPSNADDLRVWCTAWQAGIAWSRRQSAGAASQDKEGSHG